MTKIEKLDEISNPSSQDWMAIQPSGQKTQKIKMGVFAPKEHGHQIQDIEELQTVLDGKADSTALADTVSALQLDIDSKAQINHNHPISSITNLQTVLDGKANGTGFDYDQLVVPSNPVIGKTWRERNSDGLIVNNWIYDGAKWLSIEKKTLHFVGGSSTANSFFNLDTRYDYIFEDLIITFFCTLDLSNTQWIRADLVIGQNRNPGNSQIGQGIEVNQSIFTSGLANTTQSRLISLNRNYSPQGNELIYCGFARLGTQNHWGTMILNYRLVRK